MNAVGAGGADVGVNVVTEKVVGSVAVSDEKKKRNILNSQKLGCVFSSSLCRIC